MKTDIVPESLIRKYTDLAGSVGLSYQITKVHPKYNYDGKGVAFFSLRSKDDRDLFAHELAHWLVATPEERRMVNFGLGIGHSDMLYSEPCSTRTCGIDHIEVLASLLGIFIQRNVGDPSYKYTWTSHSHNKSKLTITKRYVRELLAEGHLTRINGKLTPTYRIS